LSSITFRSVNTEPRRWASTATHGTGTRMTLDRYSKRGLRN